MSGDFYDRYRRPLRAAAAGTVGQFDPLSLLVWLDPTLMAAIDANEHPFLGRDAGRLDLVRASATHLHEEMHWWQHVGTSAGFACAMIGPLQTAFVVPTLRTLEDAARIKPLLRLHEVLPEALEHRPENVAINTWMDLECAFCLLQEPARTAELRRNPLFEAPGHSIVLLHESLGRFLREATGHDLVPDGAALTDSERALAARKADNFAYDAPARVPRVGLRAIMEGQARMMEVRYLARCLGTQFDWSACADAGLLGATYVEALDHFLRLAGWPAPSHPLSPAVAVFLAACEVALNPDVGHPTPADDAERLLEDAVAGRRLERLALALRDGPDPCAFVREDDGAAGPEHDRVVAALCAPLGWPTPREVARRVLARAAATGLDVEAESRLDRAATDGRAPALKLVVASHVRLMRVRAECPELLAWTDRCSTSAGPERSELHQRYRDRARTIAAPFYLERETRLVRVGLHLGADDEARDRLAVAYFQERAVADLVRQWMARSGPFCFDYAWTAHGADFEAMLRRAVRADLGLELDALRLLPA